MGKIKKPRGEAGLFYFIPKTTIPPDTKFADRRTVYLFEKR
jgi:hypothetical protein